MKTVTKSEKYRVTQSLLTYCQKKFRYALNAQRVTLPSQWHKFDLDALSLYQYPEDENDLLFYTDRDRKKLKELGWLKPSLKGRVFIPWFKSTGVQLCPIDLTKWEIEKPPSGLNRDIPIFLKKVKSCAKPHEPIVITSDPLNAMLLNAQNIHAISLDSYSPLKNQVKWLSQLQGPLIYLEQETPKTEQGAEITVKTLAKFLDVHIKFIDMPVREYVLNIDENLHDHICGVELLARRIMHKHNGKSDYERNIDIVEACQAVGETKAGRFLQYAKLEGSINYAHYSHSLRLFADLIDAKVCVDASRDIVRERTGITVFLQDANYSRLR